jgi:hypothetical protein
MSMQDGAAFYPETEEACLAFCYHVAEQRLTTEYGGRDPKANKTYAARR